MRIANLIHRTLLFSATGGLLMLVGVFSSQWYASHIATQQLEAQLHEVLPERIDESALFSLGDASTLSLLEEQIQEDLDTLTANNFYTATCRATVLGLDGNSPSSDRSGTSILVRWESITNTRQLELKMDCSLSSPMLWSSQFVLGFLAALLLFALPTPLSPRQRQIAQVLRESGIADDQIDAYSTRSDVAGIQESGIDWFAWAITQGYAIAEALQIAEAKEQLIFDPAKNRICIHGVILELPPTPFMYYYWYASCRVNPEPGEPDGWFTNPSSNKPDRESAERLIIIMTRYGGHMKAINDLREKGLRAKILDQNRSKVKEELVTAFGEKLAARYLFELVRDAKTARNRYRLALNPTLVQLAVKDSAAIGTPFPLTA